MSRGGSNTSTLVLVCTIQYRLDLTYLQGYKVRVQSNNGRINSRYPPYPRSLPYPPVFQCTSDPAAAVCVWLILVCLVMHNYASDWTVVISSTRATPKVSSFQPNSNLNDAAINHPGPINQT